MKGKVAERDEIIADGTAHHLEFSLRVPSSACVAARIPISSHTNPIFVSIDGEPIRASRRSAAWCLAAVDQCWSQKAPLTRASEREEARAAYEHARRAYRRLIAESPVL